MAPDGAMSRLQGVARRARQLPAQTGRLVVDRDVSRDGRFRQRGQHGVSKAATLRWHNSRPAMLLPVYGEQVVIAGPGDCDLPIRVGQRAMLDRIRGQLMQRHADALRRFPVEAKLGTLDGDTGSNRVRKVVKLRMHERLRLLIEGV